LEKINEMDLEHNYRTKENRQGHSNTKKSYWGKGFDTLQDFYECSKKEEIEKYKKEHKNCCGLSKPGKSLKDEKKQAKKIKRKEFRKKKKSENKKEDDQNKKENEDEDKKTLGRKRYGRKRYGKILYFIGST